jgi:DNA (cytosine-5)-methyltransferase 1
METWLLKDMGETAGKPIDVAVTLRARDYKGLDNYGSNGVIEVMADVNVIGSLEAKFESTSRIYDVGGCSPTLSTMQGGNQEPKILEAKQLGFMDNGTGKHQSNTVYDENALCPNITTVEGGGTQQIKVCESQIVAMRGRNPDNPSDRTVGSPTEQRLEVNMQGTSNCLTSVQKDNMVLEKQGISTKGKQNDIASTILSGYERSNMTGFNADNAVIEKVGQISSNGSQCSTVISDNGISANLVAGTHGYANSHIATQYRIRKLTPRECGRLMGVSDEDIDKMAAVNSNTQLYRQFGNSIVVQVMCAMFKNLNIKQGDTV